MKIFTAAQFAVIANLCAVLVDANFTLSIVHTNDVHSRIEQLNLHGGTCNQGQECFGGVARRHTLINRIRAENGTMLLLDAGDQFQGTYWFGVYKGLAAVQFMNLDRYDAMCLGNHEFDNGVEGIIPFIRNASFPILAANADVSEVPDWPNSTHYANSTVVVKKGVKIGVIGYLTQDTAWLSNPGKVRFTDVIAAVQREATLLTAQGVRVLVALGHAGFTMDKRVAREVKEIDVVVGGHTSTFLYNGDPPSREKPEGNYPYVVTREDGSPCLVVQAYNFGKYMGRLNVDFSDQGEVATWFGNPILLNSSIPQNRTVAQMVKHLSGPIEKARQVSIGKTFVLLFGRKPTCRVRDCNLGNLVTDAVLKMSQKTPDSSSWATVGAAIWNGGGLRASIIKERNESITYEDLLSVLPFGNQANVALIPGHLLYSAFEWSVSDTENMAGRFLQVSGIKMRYDPERPLNERVTGLQIKCLECEIPKYEPVQTNRTYKVVAPDYILKGGDGFHMLRNVTRHPMGIAIDLVRDYIEQEKTIIAGLEDRILAEKFTECKQQSQTAKGDASRFLSSSAFIFLSSVFCLLFL